MARPFKPIVKSGSYYPSRRWTPLVYPGGYTTANGGEKEPDPVVKTVSGGIVHVLDALAWPAQNVTISIEPVQAGTGDPSPDNVRPISGWTGANVYRTGKNLFPSTPPENMIAGQLSGSTIASATNGRIFAISCKPNTDYTFSQKQTGTAWSVAFSNKLPAVGDSVDFRGNMTNRTGWALNSGNHTFLLIGFSNMNYWDSFATVEAQIELGTEKSSYEAYQGTTIPITFPTPPGTVYGGTLDVTTGELTVDRVAVDLGALSWTKGSTSSGHWRFQVTVSDIKMAPTAASVVNILCSQYKTGSANDTWVGIKCIAINNTTPRIFVCDESYSDAATFKAAMDGVTAVYELEEPQTYQLTPQEVQLLAGENNIWADTGSTTLTYLADGRASDTEALGILLAGRYVNHGAADEATDKEALDILLGGNR